MTGQELRTAPPRNWPEYLTAADIGAILHCSKRTAQRYIRAGKCGAYFCMGREHYVRRESFRRTLQGSEIRPRHP